MTDSAPTVSVVVRTYNEERYIQRLFEGLEKQTFRVSEIVLIDSESTDNTVGIARAAGARVVTIRKSEFTYGRALNIGCAAATGDILLIVSAHVYPVYDTFVEHMVNAFRTSNIGIAYGRQIGDERTKYAESRLMLSWFPIDNIPDQGHPFSHNGNAAVLRSVWQGSAYDERLPALEDLDFAVKAMATGWKVAYVADAPVVHIHEEEWPKIRNRYRREAKALSRITEGSTMSISKAVGLALANIGCDYASALKSGRLRGNMFDIPYFRTAQFLGAWEGFNERDDSSASLLRLLYHPGRHAPNEAERQPGSRIDYSEHRSRNLDLDSAIRSAE
ncbi:glycosyltransferase family A protein [Mycolicibacterium sp.]|uniref:glycosyltransferase family 2 protein n=1 Tax=Mycolicibacterium sp. TaxID=2320850 RepID=UPI0028AA5DBB|nr:glycosyltransferase family A protein [Mycolicibacterium sp.]